MARPLRLATVIAFALATAVSACSDDGRTLAPVDPDLTTTTVGAVIDEGPEVGSAAAFLLSSEAFPAGGEVTAAHTCAGAGESPPLAWSGTPGGAELAIVMRERAPEGTVHWIVTGIDPVIQGFGAGGVPEGAMTQVNAAGTTDYLPPCPPAGTGTHLYDLVLHVLDEPLAIDGSEAAPDLAARIETASRAAAPLAATVNT